MVALVAAVLEHALLDLGYLVSTRLVMRMNADGAVSHIDLLKPSGWHYGVSVVVTEHRQRDLRSADLACHG